MGEFTNTHRYLTQFMLTNGQVSLPNALLFCDRINAGVATITGLNTLIMEINREIKKQCFKISQTICEVTGEDVLVWINTKNDELSKLQSGFPPIECEYFHAVMQEILNSEEHAILYPRCINISSTLTAPLSRENGEKAVLKWVQGGYLVKKEQYVYLGARMILEFTTYLRKNTENCICGLCAELVFIGKPCFSCGKPYHNHCIDKYLQNQHKCPDCKNEWQEQENTVENNTTEASDSEETD